MLAIRRHNVLQVTLILCLFSSCTMIFANEMRLFKLNYASPHSVASSLESLFKGQLTAVAVTSMNAVAVRTTTPSLFEDIKALIDVLDRKPATFRFTVRSQQKDSHKAQGISPGINVERSTNSGVVERSVVALELSKASFTNDKVRIFRIAGPYHSHSVPVTVSDGLMVSGRLIDNSRVAIQVWFSQAGSPYRSEILLTELEVKPGVWLGIGGLQQSASNDGREINLGDKAKIKSSSQTYTSDRQYLIKVDLIQ